MSNRKSTIVAGIALSAAFVLQSANVASVSRAGPNNRSFLTQLAAKRGQDYVRAREALLRRAGTGELRKQMEAAVKDEHRVSRERLLARVCLLRLTRPADAGSFEKALARLVGEHRRRFGVKTAHSDERTRMASFRVQDVVMTLQDDAPSWRKWREAFKTVTAHDESLWAECLIWHTPESLTDLLRTARHVGTKDRLRLSEGAVAQYYAALAAVISPKYPAWGAEALEAWGVAEPTQSEFALLDIMELALRKDAPADERSRAVEAIIRIGRARQEHTRVGGKRRYVASGLLRLLLESELAPAARLRAARGIAQLGGDKAVTYLRQATQVNQKEVRQAAQQALNELHQAEKAREKSLAELQASLELALREGATEAERKRAVGAIVRLGRDLEARGYSHDIRQVATGSLLRIAEEPNAPPSVRLDALRGCSMIGDKTAIRHLRAIAERAVQDSEIKKAAQEAIRQLEAAPSKSPAESQPAGANGKAPGPVPTGEGVLGRAVQTVFVRPETANMVHGGAITARRLQTTETPLWSL